MVADSFGAFTRVYGQGGDDEVSAGGEGSQLTDGGSGDDIVNAGGFAGNATGIGGSGTDIVYFTRSSAAWQRSTGARATTRSSASRPAALRPVEPVTTSSRSTARSHR